MKLVDSRKQQLNYAQILHAYHSNEVKAEKLKDFTVWMTVMAATMAKLKTEGAIIGNTFFMYKRGSGANNGKVMVWAMNVDTLQNMVDSATEFVTRMAHEGVTTIVSIYQNPAVTRVLRQAFAKVKTPEDTMQVTKTRKGQQVMVMKLDGGDHV